MACKRLLLVIGVVAAASAVASGALPLQPARIQADVVVTGFVPCNNGTSMRTGSAPGFPGALVELQCTGAGSAGALAANATTDGKGWFRMAVNTTVAPSSVASSCGLVVGTPLAACNAALPATGALHSGLRLLVSMVFFPRGFSYLVSG
ncbi:phylloplanin-like [Miscanthus floridulus]|uniref:phylloplanin-like n=1 Tax=Miscanthus floridulus TaxID=154761 RepID=UPI003459755F